jgi:hypothetical protein
MPSRRAVAPVTKLLNNALYQYLKAAERIPGKSLEFGPGLAESPVHQLKLTINRSFY